MLSLAEVDTTAVGDEEAAEFRCGECMASLCVPQSSFSQASSPSGLELEDAGLEPHHSPPASPAVRGDVRQDIPLTWQFCVNGVSMTLSTVVTLSTSATKIVQVQSQTSSSSDDNAPVTPSSVVMNAAGLSCNSLFELSVVTPTEAANKASQTESTSPVDFRITPFGMPAATIRTPASVHTPEPALAVFTPIPEGSGGGLSEESAPHQSSSFHLTQKTPSSFMLTQRSTPPPPAEEEEAVVGGGVTSATFLELLKKWAKPASNAFAPVLEDETVHLNWWDPLIPQDCLVAKLEAEALSRGYYVSTSRSCHYPPVESRYAAISVVSAAGGCVNIAILGGEPGKWQVSRAYKIRYPHNKAKQATVEERALIAALHREHWWMRARTADQRRRKTKSRVLLCNDNFSDYHWPMRTEGCRKWLSMKYGNLDAVLEELKATEDYLPIRREYAIRWRSLEQDFDAYVDDPNVSGL